jgi:hypothetical protein
MKLHALIAFCVLPAAGHLLRAQESLGAEFAAAKTQYELKVNAEVQRPFDAAVVDLNSKYTASLDRALETAQKGGRLNDAVAVKAEKEGIALGKGVPATDDDTTPAEVRKLRDVYRASFARLDADRSKRLEPIHAAFLRSLDTLVSRLTNSGKLEEAVAVKKYRDGLNAPAPPPATLGRTGGGGAGAATGGGRIATVEQLIAKPWAMNSSTKKGTFRFTSDNVMSSSSGFKATWSIKGKTVVLDWGKNNFTQFSLELQPSDGDLVLRGLDSAGKFNDVTLTQAAK